jgi:hypothetical protein
VGIELKDNQPWTLSPSILHQLSRFSWRIKYNQSSCNAKLQWLEVVRIHNNHTSIIKVTAPPIAHSFIGNPKRLQLIESQMMAKQVICIQDHLSPLKKKSTTTARHTLIT